jgi:hypothetical protein
LEGGKNHNSVETQQREKKISVMELEKTEARNNCAGEGQQEFN